MNGFEISSGNLAKYFFIGPLPEAEAVEMLRPLTFGEIVRRVRTWLTDLIWREEN